MAFDALGENDRHLDDFESLPPKPVRHFNLNAVTFRENGIEIDGLKRATAKTFVAAGRVAKRHSGDNPDVNFRAPAQYQPLERPVDDAHAAGITRAEHKVGILIFRGFR